MQARRVRPAAAVRATGVCAGTMESSSGSASAPPMPRKIVRLFRCFLVMNMLLIPLHGGCVGLLGFAHLERRAPHDAENEAGETIAVARGVAANGADHGHVVPLGHAAQTVGEQVF